MLKPGSFHYLTTICNGAAVWAKYTQLSGIIIYVDIVQGNIDDNVEVSVIYASYVDVDVDVDVKEATKQVPTLQMISALQS